MTDIPYQDYKSDIGKLQKRIFRAVTRLLMALPIGTAGGIY